MGNFIDLTGKKFGRLTVNYDTGKRYKTKVIWNCICDCGKITEIPSSRILSGHTSSCGCLHKEMLSKRSIKNLTGKRFGKLIVQYEKGRTKTKNVIWHCLCDCGKETDVTGTLLTFGSTKSCGCINESQIASELKKYYIDKFDAKIEYNILKNPETFQWLSYDIYIPYGKNPNINGLYIEINGEQHYKFVKFWHKTNENFLHCVYLDNIKKKFAENNGFYISIDLRKIKTTIQAIDYINCQKEKIEEISCVKFL